MMGSCVSKSSGEYLPLAGTETVSVPVLAQVKPGSRAGAHDVDVVQVLAVAGHEDGGRNGETALLAVVEAGGNHALRAVYKSPQKHRPIPLRKGPRQHHGEQKACEGPCAHLSRAGGANQAPRNRVYRRHVRMALSATTIAAILRRMQPRRQRYPGSLRPASPSRSSAGTHRDPALPSTRRLRLPARRRAGSSASSRAGWRMRAASRRAPAGHPGASAAVVMLSGLARGQRDKSRKHHTTLRSCCPRPS